MEAINSIHTEKPDRGMVMHLLQVYGNKSNPKGIELARKLRLIP